MRLLIVTTLPVTIEAFFLPLAQHFRSLGWKVDAAANNVSHSTLCREAFDEVHDISWSRNPLHPNNLLVVPRRLRRLIKRNKYDIVHVHTPVASFVTRLSLRNVRGVKVIYTAHGFHFHQAGNPVSNAIFLSLEKLAGYWTDHLVVINDQDEQAARRNRLVAQERITHIHGVGVDMEAYSPQTISAEQLLHIRRELGVEEETSLFIVVAELIRRKRHDDVLKALARVNERRRRTGRAEAHLILAGRGPRLGPLQDLASELGVSPHVHFLGFRRDIPALVRSSMALILSSQHEGLPRSILEALCLEVPIIGTDIRGVRCLLGRGAGILYELGDIDALARAMEWVLEHSDEAKEMGRLGRQQVKPYEISEILKCHEQLYERVLAESR